jgi:hypothetical protein
MSWLSRHAPSVEAVAATVTALVAVAALIGVKFQLDEADRLQKAQSAREAYRAHLALAATLPQFAQPDDACQLIQSDQAGAYSAFVDHLLYSAEQMLDVSDGWEETFLTQLAVHSDYICAADGPRGETKNTVRLISSFKNLSCPALTSCQGGRE